MSLRAQEEPLPADIESIQHLPGTTKMLHTSPFMSRKNPNAALYQRVHVESQIEGAATPHRLVSMLFDGFFDSVATAIVEEGLRASLDLKVGGKVAADLNALYAYVAARLTYANLKNDVAALDECVKLLKPVQDAWNAIAPQPQVAN